LTIGGVGFVDDVSTLADLQGDCRVGADLPVPGIRSEPGQGDVEAVGPTGGGWADSSPVALVMTTAGAVAVWP
jgi:hypothetical protein